MATTGEESHRVLAGLLCVGFCSPGTLGVPPCCWGYCYTDTLCVTMSLIVLVCMHLQVLWPAWCLCPSCIPWTLFEPDCRRTHRSLRRVFNSVVVSERNGMTKAW